MAGQDHTMAYFEEDMEYDADTGQPCIQLPVVKHSKPRAAEVKEQAPPPGPKYSEFQVSDEFPPNKESTWPYPQEHAGWVLAHDSLRGELADISDVLTRIKGRGLKSWEVQAIKKVAAAHFLHTHGHHYNEDEIMCPFLKERFIYPEKVSLSKLSDMLVQIVFRTVSHDALRKA